MENKNGVAIFLPAWNEAANLPYVVDDAVSYLQSRNEPFTVLIVDDGSTDNTPDIVQELGRTYGDNVKYVRHDRNMGYGAALRTGFNECLKTNHQWISFCDADGQFKPRELEKLLEGASESGCDIAIGYRITRPDKINRKIMGLGWLWLSRLVLGYQAKDVDCGFKLFERHALEALSVQLTGEHATISPEILVRAQRAGHRIIEVGVQNYPRRYGEPSGAQFHVVWNSIIGLLLMRQQLNQQVDAHGRMA